MSIRASEALYMLHKEPMFEMENLNFWCSMHQNQSERVSRVCWCPGRLSSQQVVKLGSGEKKIALEVTLVSIKLL